MSLTQMKKLDILLNHLPDIWEENRKKLNLKGVGKVELKSIVDLNEWLWYFKNSKAVFTDSFHGTIFSIIFKKPFITLKNNGRGGKRFISLLEPINLLDRLFDNPECINTQCNLYEEIKYDKSYYKLKKIKNYSYSWLNSILKKIFE